MPYVSATGELKSSGSWCQTIEQRFWDAINFVGIFFSSLCASPNAGSHVARLGGLPPQRRRPVGPAGRGSGPSGSTPGSTRAVPRANVRGVDSLRPPPGCGG